jgi:hypothetical protein
MLEPEFLIAIMDRRVVGLSIQCDRVDSVGSYWLRFFFSLLF